jgi:hypothetical protein
MAMSKVKAAAVVAVAMLAGVPAAAVVSRGLAADPPKVVARPATAPVVPVASAPAPAAAADWRARFEAAYRLERGQVVKRVAPPYIPERKRYFDDIDFFRMYGILDGVFVFHDEDGKVEWNRSTRSAATIGNLLRRVAGVPSYKLQMDEFDRMRTLDGDWVVAPKSTEEQQVAGVAAQVRQGMQWPIAFEKRTVEREVFVVRGTYEPAVPPSEPGQPPLIRVHLDPPRKAVNNRSIGEFKAFLDELGETMDTEVVDETDGPKPKSVYWTSEVQSGVAGEFRQKLLANVAKQTGLTFTAGRQKRETWVAVQEGGPAK